MKPNQTRFPKSRTQSFLALTGMVVAAFFFLLPSGPALAVLDGTLSIDPATQTVAVDDTGIVYTGAIDPGTNEVNVVTFSITFDPAVLQLDSITRSAAFDNTMSSDIDNINGTGTITVFNLGANYITTPQDVADFSFTALSGAADSPIDVDSSADAAAHGEYVILTRTGATVTVNDFSGATPPDITEDAPITSPTIDDTPDYSFSVSENVDLTYFGDCSSATATATTGSNTITFNALADGAHSNCVIRATDTEGDWRNLRVTSFTVDTTPPTILSVSSDLSNGSYTTGQVVDIDVTFSEPVTSTGDVTVTMEAGVGSATCTFQLTNDTTGTCDYTVQPGDSSADLDIDSIAGTIDDEAGNPMADFIPASTLAGNKNLVIDTTAPTIAETTPVTTPTNDRTPNYVFSSDEAGTIVYGGSCVAGNTTAVNGSNTATFGTLADGTYADCTIEVEDAAGNVSNQLAVPSFTVHADPPVRSNGAPSGNLPGGTTSTTISLDTDENATCRYSTTNGVAYASMTNTFSGGGTTSHSATVNSLSDGNSYTYYVRCIDAASNANTTDYSIAFGVADATPPVIAQVTPVTTPTTDTTPNYTFSSTEAGTITYGGDCSSADTSASAGSNTITFNALAVGTHSNCTIRVTDAADNPSNLLSVTSFTIEAAPVPIVEEEDNDDSIDTSSKNYKLYKKYKKFRGVYNRRIYRELKKLRKENAGEFYKLKDIYWKYKYFTPEEFAKLSQTIKDQYEKYKRYHKYRLYKKYHDKVYGDE